MARYSEEIINEVRQSNDIVDVISQYVHLKLFWTMSIPQ